MKAWKGDLILLVTAMIWGFAFVAQRSGMDSIGPFAYSAARFALGALVLLPFWLWRRRSAPVTAIPPLRRLGNVTLLGLLLFGGVSLQQLGLVTTTAANAGFITCFYVVLVPIAGLLFGKRVGWRVWVGAGLALGGLGLLSLKFPLSMAFGDLLELLGALVWTAHIILVGRYAKRLDALELSVGQILVCALLSLGAALVLEPEPFAGLGAAAWPVLYGGVLSIGLAFTLQVVGQRSAHPARASIILSMEALFAAIGGVLILGESLTLGLALGGGAMLAGMVLAQWEPKSPAALPAGRSGVAGEPG